MLPVELIRGEVIAALSDCGRVVVSAPPGAGKSTQVPRFLQESGLVEGKIVVTQPRRLAARMLAARVAEELGERPGGLVGFRTRHESAAGPDTRILFVTEGLLVRQLQEDPRLEGVEAVLLDEFHERHLEGDLALGLVRSLQQGARRDLKLAVMSATLDTDLVQGYLSCPVVRSGHEPHHVEIRHLGGGETEPVFELAATAVSRLLRSEAEGDVLVFMPGVWEIRRTLERCAQLGLAERALLLPLHGELPAADQDRAVRPASRRRVIVATNVAETSITIPGVRHVIDSGLARVPHYDQRRGMNVLAVQKISQASARQRAGRAGRTGPGTCLRLYSATDFQGRRTHELAEVLRLDLSQAALSLHAMGFKDMAAFPWLDAPPAGAVEAAERLLEILQAIPPGGGLTESGELMAKLPMHPRLSRMVVESSSESLPAVCRRAALLAERSILDRSAPRQFADISSVATSDIELLEEALERARADRFDPSRCRDAGINPHAAREVDRAALQFLSLARRPGPSLTPRLNSGQAVGARTKQLDPEGTVNPFTGSNRKSKIENRKSEPRLSLLRAFPDRVAALRSACAGVYELVGGVRATLASAGRFGTPDVVVALDVMELISRHGPASTISLAEPVSMDGLLEVFPEHVEERVELAWNQADRSVEQVRTTLYRGLEVARAVSRPDDLVQASAMLADRVMAEKLPLDGWTDDVDKWIARVRCVAEWFPEEGIPTYDAGDVALVLREAFEGSSRYSHVKRTPLLGHFKDILGFKVVRFVEKMAPDRIQLPRGHRMRVSYFPGSRPKGSSRIQDLYDLAEQPRVAGGRIPVLLEILAPSNRPLQTTDDLKAFWRDLYPKLKKQLSRKYPRHEWR